MRYAFNLCADPSDPRPFPILAHRPRRNFTVCARIPRARASTEQRTHVRMRERLKFATGTRARADLSRPRQLREHCYTTTCALIPQTCDSHERTCRRVRGYLEPAIGPACAPARGRADVSTLRRHLDVARPVDGDTMMNARMARVRGRGTGRRRTHARMLRTRDVICWTQRNNVRGRLRTRDTLSSATCARTSQLYDTHFATLVDRRAGASGPRHAALDVARSSQARDRMLRGCAGVSNPRPKRLKGFDPIHRALCVNASGSRHALGHTARTPRVRDRQALLPWGVCAGFSILRPARAVSN
jgi:hypothetical protein